MANLNRALFLCSLFVCSPVLFAAEPLAQPTNGNETLLQDALLAASASSESQNSVMLFSILGESLEGSMADADFTLRIGYDVATPIPSPGARSIQVAGTLNEPVSSIIVNGTPAVIDGLSFYGDVSLVEGTNTIEVGSTDLAGNWGSSSITVSLDTHPPGRPTVDSYSNVNENSTHTLTGTKTRGTSIWINGVETPVDRDAMTWTAVVNLVEGDNVFNIVAKDEAGNESTAFTITTILDNLPPVLSNIAYIDIHDFPLALDGATSYPKTNFTPVTITGLVDDSLTTVTISNHPAARSVRNFRVDMPLLLGTNPLTLIATSPNGYVTIQTLQTILGTIPTVTSIQPTDATKLYADSTATIRASAMDAENDPLLCQILLDAEVLVDWFPGAEHPWTPSGNEAGLHTVEIRVKDDFGGYGSKQGEVYVLHRPFSAQSQ